LPGWFAGAGGTFDVVADNNQTKAGSSIQEGGGQLNVLATYSSDAVGGYTDGFTVSASDLFIVQGSDVHEFSGSVELTGTGTLTAASSYYSTSLPDPAPLPPGEFSFPAYPASFTYLPPPLPAAGPVAFEFSSDPVDTLGTRLRVAQTFRAIIFAGDAGSVAMTTIVNPEPASLLLCAFGAGLFGLGYRRKRQLQIDATT